MSAPSEARIPCLDGLRAVSISLVILWHLVGSPAETPRIHIVGDLGNLGVRMFFVISGFLITTLLVTELDRKGTIALGQFYLRRTFRIFPAFYAYIAIIAGASLLGFVALERHDLLAAVTYTMNYHPRRAWELGHLWSLAVEEQFYLLWPAVVLLVGRRGGLGVVLLTIAAAPMIRVATHLYWPADRPSIGESFQTIADSLATGCGLALLRERMSAREGFAAFQRRGAAPVLWIAIAVLVNAFHDKVSFGYSIGETITNIALALTIDACLRSPQGPVGRFLERRPLVLVGTLSYSIYLWQQPFMSHRPSWATSLPLNLVCVAVLAAISHYGVEKPMLEVRKRLSQRRAPASVARMG